MTAEPIDQTGLEHDDEVEPNAYAEEAARRLLDEAPDQETFDKRFLMVTRAIDRLTYAVLGLVTEVGRHPGGMMVVEGPALVPGQVQQVPGALPGPFFHVHGQRYARTPDGVVAVDEHGVPLPAPGPDPVTDIG